MSDQPMHLKLLVEAALGADVEEHETAVRQLLRDVNDLDVNVTSRFQEGALPAGAKGALPIDLGTLFVTLAASGGVLTTLIGAVQTWMTNHSAHNVTLEMNGAKLSLTSASVAQQQQLIDAWIAGNAARAADKAS